MDWEVLSSNINGKWLHYVFDQEAPRGTCASRETGFICKRSGCRWKNGACADFVFVLICFDETFSRRRDANELQHQLWWRSIQRATKVCKPNTNINTNSWCIQHSMKVLKFPTCIWQWHWEQKNSFVFYIWYWDHRAGLMRSIYGQKLLTCIFEPVMA